MNITFGKLEFSVEKEKIFLCAINGRPCAAQSFVEVQISGENKDSHMGAKSVLSSEGRRFCYVTHTKTENTLEIVQRSPFVEAKTTFLKYDDCNALRVNTEVKNISDEEIVLEEVSALCLPLAEPNETANAKNLYFYRFLQSHHAECQPRRQSFFDYGFHTCVQPSQRRIAFANVGSWSTKEALPQGIVQNAKNGRCVAFQIESNASWYYEISDLANEYYLWLGSASLPFCSWSKRLKKGESYKSVNVAVCFGQNVEKTLAELTKYRRHISGKCAADEHLPAIFNEYMHFSWDSPTEETTRMLAPVVKKTGVEYYVIDCGWHNEEKGSEVYPYVGQWKESKARFPSGLRKTTDYIRSLGMKVGLWIEPEIVGIRCKEMLDYYDEDCFLQRNGKRVTVMNRHFLDFRARKVKDYLTETIRRMVEDYGAEYIKTDYNQDCGSGGDYLSFCFGEGLEACASAYLDWIDDVRKKFPQVLFETCASGGMRMDYRTLSHFSVVSTSDQTDYLEYPHIACNVLAAVLPEQAAVWSYPVTEDCSGEDVSDERIYMNMVNSFLGRIHLASHLERLTERQLALVREGVETYRALASEKKKSVPKFPTGFGDFSADFETAGFETDTALYLAVWNTGGALHREIELVGYKNVQCVYPKKNEVDLSYKNNTLFIEFTQPFQARFLKLEK